MRREEWADWRNQGAGFIPVFIHPSMFRLMSADGRDWWILTDIVRSACDELRHTRARRQSLLKRAVHAGTRSSPSIRERVTNR